MQAGDTISVRGDACTIAFVPEHHDYVIVRNAGDDQGMAFHAFPEMIDLECPECGSTNTLRGIGHRLPSCLSCGMAWDTMDDDDA